MEWFNASDAAFFGMVWAVSFGSSLFVTLGNNSVKSANKCFVLGGVSGFFALAVIGFLIGRSNEPIGYHWYYICLASTIGLCSRLQLALLKYLELNQNALFNFFLGKFGINVDEDKTPKED